MKEKIEEVTARIQEQCLWQFFSRSWDREENIEGILTMTGKLLNGEKVILETAADKAFYSDAKFLADDFQKRLPWISELDKAGIMELIEGVKKRLLYITVKKSRNCELNMPNY
jgi:vanadium nitrogenase delta subunit